MSTAATPGCVVLQANIVIEQVLILSVSDKDPADRNWTRKSRSSPSLSRTFDLLDDDSNS
jgi:hypothetical protein